LKTLFEENFENVFRVFVEDEMYLVDVDVQVVRPLLEQFRKIEFRVHSSRRVQPRAKALEQRAYWAKQLEGLAEAAQRKWPLEER